LLGRVWPTLISDFLSANRAMKAQSHFSVPSCRRCRQFGA
jgi:hypothetical protein